MELYIHIPFCIKKCNYCDFLSFPTDCREGEKVIGEYLLALNRELQAHAELLAGRTVDTVFIGGGTPSVVQAKQMKGLLENISRLFVLSPDAEYSIECNPGTVNAEKLKLYKEYGINRLSFGLQSTNNEELKFIGRIHTFEDFLESYDLARKEGFNNINIDLMSALPLPSGAAFSEDIERMRLDSWKNTLRTVAGLKPEHISAYSLIIEEGTPFGDAKLNLPEEETERLMYRETAEILGEYGYERYEISNYSLPGKECRHNIGYWTGKEYIGAGLGASSYAGGMRWRNVSDMQEYIAGSSLPQSIRTEAERLGDNELMEEFAFLGLRMIKGISTGEFSERFGRDFFEVYGRVVEKYLSCGLLKLEGSRIMLTENGLDVCNTVMADFLLSV